MLRFCGYLVPGGREASGGPAGSRDGGLGRESDTDHSVPGRLRGRQDKYEEIGAEPYIVASEFSWLFGCTFYLHLFNVNIVQP